MDFHWSQIAKHIVSLSVIDKKIIKDLQNENEHLKEQVTTYEAAAKEIALLRADLQKMTRQVKRIRQKNDILTKTVQDLQSLSDDNYNESEDNGDEIIETKEEE